MNIKNKGEMIMKKIKNKNLKPLGEYIYIHTGILTDNKAITLIALVITKLVHIA